MALLLTSCINFNTGVMGNGEVTTQDRATNEPFTEILASEGLDVYISQGETATIKVEADSNVIDLIATDIKQGELHIHTTENIGRATKTVYVSLPALTSIKATSGADVETQNTIRGANIRLSASSGADLSATLVANSINASTSSGASLKVSGESDNLTASASSGSDLVAAELMSRNVIADASSGAYVKVHAIEKLDANASSGGDVDYTGEAKVSQVKSSGGSVSKED